jgi:hypothetical protein
MYTRCILVFGLMALIYIGIAPAELKKIDHIFLITKVQTFE